MQGSTRFHIPGAPDHELSRSPAASMIGLLAEQSELLLSHFEYRVHLPPPEHWVPENRPDLGEIAPWQGGVLPECKYQGFRNDLTLGSFHPGHRAKWTAHELCHGLVGFAWRPGASRFYHALAARLSELLPVALFYFFDEAYLQRCPLHTSGGALFSTYCKDCERIAQKGPGKDSTHASRFMQEGRAFVERELHAVSMAKKYGRPVTSPWANLDLMSDGLAYASAQGKRLNSPQFERYMYLFFPDGCGLHHELESLEVRIEEILQGICYGAPVAPLKGHRWLWIAQDIGWRMLEVSSETEGMASRHLLRMTERLAADPSEQMISETIQQYEVLHQDYALPDPQDLFATGYTLPHEYGLSHRQIAEGIQSAMPETWSVLEQKGLQPERLAAAFSQEDCHERTPLGHRFTRWLKRKQSGLCSELAHFEATVAHAPPASATTLSLDPFAASECWRTCEDVTVLPTTHDVLKHMGIDDQGGEAEPFLAIRRDATGEVHLIRLPTHLGKALQAMEQKPMEPGKLGLVEQDVDILADWQLIIPDQFDMSRPNLLASH